MKTTGEIVYRPDSSTQYLQSFFDVGVSAGFPSPAADYEEGKLDLNRHLIRNPAATFFVKANGDSMIGAGIHSGDILIVDRSLEPKDKSVVIAVINGELTVKKIRIRNRKIILEPENHNYPVQEITPDTDFEVWGVVTSVIHRL
ncbi:MAG: translesion error-prone DNA polymerase V autoproteolytic subunit [Sedimentisphaerales bacterium]|nr:translesion error-prone DNA polymerase V autoproteolytic subunit [Sedimentisphaerales bacterium]